MVHESFVYDTYVSAPILFLVSDKNIDRVNLVHLSFTHLFCYRFALAGKSERTRFFARDARSETKLRYPGAA